MPKISVIIPAYRPASFDLLRKSMKANANIDAEWIVVNDGSGPAYDEIFAELKTDGVQVIALAKNGGQAAARNVGLAAACADWVKFLDADDRLDIGHLSVLIGATKASVPTAIPFAPTCHFFPNGRRIVNQSWDGLKEEAAPQLERLLYAPFLHHCGALFPRNLLVDLDGYDESLATDEDGDLLIRVLLSGAHFIAIPEANYQYIHHGGADRVSADDDGRKLVSRLRVCEKVEEAYADRGVAMPSGIRQALAMRIDKIAISYWVTHNEEARAALNHARELCSYYPVPGHWMVRFMRRLTGPSVTVFAVRLSRRLRGRSSGGAQA